MNELTQLASNRVSLTKIIEFGVQKTYHDLTVLAELLPRKTDMEKKVEIVNFAERTRQLFIRLLALVKWAGTASKIEQCQDIVAFLDKQALLFINTADNMANIARTTLVQARLPSFQLPCAVEVLTLGTYSRMPTCVRDKTVPPDPITLREKRATYDRLNHIIEQRLATANIHPAMRNLKIEFGRVTFHVENEFDLKLTVLSDNPSSQWYVLEVDLLVEDADTGEGRDLMHPSDVEYMKHLVQNKMNASQNPLYDVYGKLHNFCLSLQIEVLHDQIERLRDRLSSSINQQPIRIKEHKPGRELAIQYWGGKNSFKIQIDQSDPSKPLKLIHQPDLVISNSNSEIVERESIFKPGHVSIEQLITDTIQKRAYIKLNQLASELREKKYGKCTISGVPSLLHVCCLDPCAPSEELLISIDLNGSYLAHVPQYEKSCMLADNIQESLNSNRSKLGTYFDQLKIWLSKKRCHKTIDYLSVTVSESLPLCPRANHAKLDDKVPRLFFQFNKYNYYYLMAEFSISDINPYNLDTTYSLLVTEPAPSSASDSLDFVEADCSADLVVVENILRLDVSSILASNYCYETNVYDKLTAYNGGMIPGKKDSSKSNSDPITHGMASHDTCTLGTAPPVSLINELPQLVSFCEEKLAHLALEKELRNRNFNYDVSHTETSGYAYCVTFNQVPSIKTNGYSDALRRDTAVMTVCLHEKPQSSKIWHCSYIFKDCPIVSQSPREQSSRRLVFTPYESPLLNSSMVSKFIDDIQLDWACMAHLYDVVTEFARDIRSDPKILNSIVIKSFNYKKLVIIYGSKRCFSVSIVWKPYDRRFHLVFSVVGGFPFNSNPHSCMATHYKHEFNQHKSIKILIHDLNITLRPLMVLQELPVYPFFGLTSSRPDNPTITFCIVPLSSTHVKLVYRNWHCIDITMQSDGLIVVRDGAYSKFDRNKTIEELNSIHHFETLLYKNSQSTCYVLNMDEFNKVFQTSHLERHLGMSFMIKNIHKKLYPNQPANQRLVPPMTDNVISCASDHMQYRFSIDPTRALVQMKAVPNMVDEWRPEDIDVIERYFETRICCYPFKADPFTGFRRVLFEFQKDVLRDFVELFKMELFPDPMDMSMQWNIAFCHLIPKGTPYLQNSGMSSICILKQVILFVLQLTKRRNPSFPSIYLPLNYNLIQNSLNVHIPAKTPPNSMMHLISIDQQLKQFCEQYRKSGNVACVIRPAIKHMLGNPNLMPLH